MKKQDVLLATTLFLTGCSAGTVFDTSRDSHDTSAEVPGFEQIKVDIFPDELPADVAEQIPNAVSVQIDDKKNDVANPGGSYGYTYERAYLSGVRIGPDQYLSAGHGIITDEGIPKHGIEFCGAVKIHSTTDTETAVTTDSDGKEVGLSGRNLLAGRQVGSYAFDLSSSVPDVALFEAPDNKHAPLAFEEPPEVLTDTPEAGDPLYAINYEPLADGSLRDPFEINLSLEDLDAGLNTPAMFGAVVLSVNANGTMDVVVGMQSYGTPADALGRKGESGGMVTDEDGQLVGLSVRSSEPMAVSQFEAKRDVDLIGIEDDQQVELNIIQLITPKLIEQLRGQLAQAPFCRAG